MNEQLPLQHHFPLKNLNTFGMDVYALKYLEVFSVDVLKAVLDDNSLSAVPRLVLGGGSNLLFTRDFPGLVLHVQMSGKKLNREDSQARYVTVAGGENWHDFVIWTLEQGLGGLENLSLIPGSVGAAPVQNIGAYGVELKDCLHSLNAFDFGTGQIRTFDKDACRFGYRDSIFKHEAAGHYVIVDVTFRFAKNWQPNLSYSGIGQLLQAKNIVNPTARDISNVIMDIRKNKLPDPSAIGNAGSFFKNPAVSPEEFESLRDAFPEMPAYRQPDGSYRIAAGWLIDQCGWKNKSTGNTGVWEKQALVLVNRGNASGNDIVRLADNIREDVKNRFGLLLEPETVII